MISGTFCMILYLRWIVRKQIPAVSTVYIVTSVKPQLNNLYLLSIMQRLGAYRNYSFEVFFKLILKFIDHKHFWNCSYSVAAVFKNVVKCIKLCIFELYISDQRKSSVTNDKCSCIIALKQTSSLLINHFMTGTNKNVLYSSITPNNSPHIASSSSIPSSPTLSIYWLLPYSSSSEE